MRGSVRQDAEPTGDLARVAALNGAHTSMAAPMALPESWLSMSARGGRPLDAQRILSGLDVS